MIRTASTVAALAALAFAASACSKPAQTPANTEAASADTTTNATEGATAKGSDAVSVAQDTTAAAVGQVSAATTGSVSEAAFVDNAAQSDMYEIEAAKLALQRSRSAKVKAFARQMIAAHEKTSAELKGIAGRIPDAHLPDRLDNRRQGLLDNLKSASADDFDARYLDQQTAAHNEAETLMKGYGRMGHNADLKTFADKTAPVIVAHDNMAKGLDRGNADHDNKPNDGGRSGDAGKERGGRTSSHDSHGHDHGPSNDNG